MMATRQQIIKAIGGNPKYVKGLLDYQITELHKEGLLPTTGQTGKRGIVYTPDQETLIIENFLAKIKRKKHTEQSDKLREEVEIRGADEILYETARIARKEARP